MILPLVALIFVDDADLHVFNSGSETTEELVVKAQRLLDAWHHILTFTGGNLKLSKCYWTLQDYQWQQGRCSMTTSTTHKLHIDVSGQRKEITHLNADQTRTLVGVPINLHHRNNQIIELFNNKITKYESKLSECKLMSTDILFGFQRY